MKPSVWKLSLFCLLLAAAAAAAQFGRIGWFEAFVEDRGFSEPFIWFDTPDLILWSFDLLLFFALGMFVASLFRTTKHRTWAVVFGAICGALHFLGSRDHVTAEASWSVYVWVYGIYFMPPLGALLGAVASQLLPNYSLKRTAASRHGVN